MFKDIYISWDNIKIDNVKKFEEDIAEKKLEIKILKPFIPAYNLFGCKFLWRIVIKLQDDEKNEKEWEFLENGIAKKDFYFE